MIVDYFCAGFLCLSVGMLIGGAFEQRCADDPWQGMPVEMRPVIKEVHPVQYTKDWSFGDPHQIGKPPQAWQQPEGVACLIVLDAERMRAIGNPVDIPRGFYTQLFVGNFPNFGDKLTMECETVEQ